MHKIFLTLLLLPSLSGFDAKAIGTGNESDSAKKTQWEFLPAKSLVPLFTADQRAHRLTACNVIGTGEVLGSMGGIFPVLNASGKKRTFQFSAAATLYTTLVRYANGGTLLNTDFFVNLFFDYKITDKFCIRFDDGHTSQHFSDDAVIDQLPVINYVRDFFSLYGIYTADRYMFYSGFIFNHNFKTTDATNAYNLSETPMLQFGFEHDIYRFPGWSEKGKKQCAFFWAGDLKLRGEFNYGSTQTLQAGYKIRNEHNRTMRIVVNWGSGYEERGQY
ncbi:MAG: hypothetical protein ACHQK8_08430, partial [Bacteroidia bacterium]